MQTKKPMSVKIQNNMRYKKILEFLATLSATHDKPSFREIGFRCGISSTSVVKFYLNELALEGLIDFIPNQSRGARINENGLNLLGSSTRVCPTCGTIVFKSSLKLLDKNHPTGREIADKLQARLDERRYKSKKLQPV